MVSGEEEPEELNGETGGGRNYKGRHNLGKWCLLSQRITLFMVKTDLLHGLALHSLQSYRGRVFAFLPLCVKRAGHRVFIRAKSVKELEMHRCC